MKRMFSFLLAVLMLLSFTACGSEKPAETTAPATEPTPVDLQATFDAMLAKMPTMIRLDETMMLNFCGIDAADCTTALVATCADGLRTDELWIIEAVDEAALERVKSMAETRLRMKCEESISYSPEQYAVVEKAQVIVDGLYLVVLVSPDVDTLAEIWHNA